MKVRIVELSEIPNRIDEAIEYVWGCWGNDSNRNFYADCMSNSLDPSKSLPKFYFALTDSMIVGSYALITNDLISRQDFMPWFACLFVNQEYRNLGIAEQLLNHSLVETKRKGYTTLYLSTDLVNFYERKGWTYLCNGYNFKGTEVKIYSKTTTE